MKKTTLLGAVIAIVLAIAGFFIFTGHKPDSNVQQAPISNKPDACSLFTATDAQHVLGSEVTKSESPGDSTMGQVVVTHCVYKSANGTATILVRKAANVTEAKTIFNGSKKSFKGEVEAPSLGESEYWVPSLGQYNILKGDNWIIASAAKDKAKAKMAAGIVAARL